VQVLKRMCTLVGFQGCIDSVLDSPGMGGLEYPSPYDTAGCKRRPKGAMAKVPEVCLIRRC
jgi:hypothetical protein